MKTIRIQSMYRNGQGEHYVDDILNPVSVVYQEYGLVLVFDDVVYTYPWHSIIKVEER